MLTPLIVLNVLFALLFWVALSAYRLSIAAKNWRQAEAEILESYVKAKDKGDRVKYKPRVHYSFQAGGNTIQGRRLTSGARYATRGKEHAEELLAPFPVGARVPVFYDPKNPQRNALIVNSEEPSRTFLYITSSLLAASVLFLLLALAG